MARAPAYPPHVGTIADKIRIGHSVTVNCGNRECLHRATLDLEDMAARFGADLPVAELVARAVCSECRARWPRISCRRRSFKRLAFPQALLRVAQ